MAALDIDKDAIGIVVVVEDEDVVRRSVCERLSAEGLTVHGVGDGLEAIRILDEVQPDLVVLDLGLPGLSGFEVLRRLRAVDGPPVILLSGRGEEADRVLGLEMGADDYVTKPFSGRELAVRARNMIRRHAGRVSAGPHHHRTFTIGGREMTIDVTARRVHIDGEEVSLTPKEFDLLDCFTRNARQVLTKPQLLRAVWQAEVGWVGEATVTEHVRRLRRKLGCGECIDTLWGVGYRFDPDS